MKAVIVVVIVLIALGALWYVAGPLITRRTVNEPLPTAEELAHMSSSKLDTIKEEVMQKAAEMPGKVMIEEMPPTNDAEPRAQKSGSFVGADSFHKGSGNAVVYEFPDTSVIVRLENFFVTNGPDLHVLLSESEEPADRDTLGEYLDLGPLKGNQGDQNYTVSDETDISRYKSVVIYCKPFHVVFSVASFE